MDRDLSNPLARAAIQTFEDLCFLCAETWSGDDDFPALEAAASVDFTGPLAGRVELHCTHTALVVLTDNMLGISGSDGALQRDAIGELANVICGNLLPSLAGPAAVYRLSPPVPVALALSPGLGARAQLQLESSAAEVRLYVDAP
jgi:CheY-specific phosphatase CheX